MHISVLHVRQMPATQGHTGGTWFRGSLRDWIRSELLTCLMYIQKVHSHNLFNTKVCVIYHKIYSYAFIHLFMSIASDHFTGTCIKSQLVATIYCKTGPVQPSDSTFTLISLPTSSGNARKSLYLSYILVYFKLIIINKLTNAKIYLTPDLTISHFCICQVRSVTTSFGCDIEPICVLKERVGTEHSKNPCKISV